MKKLTILVLGAVVLFGLPVPERFQSAPLAGVETAQPSRLDKVLDLVSSPTAFAAWDDVRLPLATVAVAASTNATYTLTGANRYVVASCTQDCRMLWFPSSTGATCTATTCEPYSTGEKLYARLPGNYTLAMFCSVAATCVLTRSK